MSNAAIIIVVVLTLVGGITVGAVFMTGIITIISWLNK